MASDLPSYVLPRHNRQSWIYPSLPPVQNTGTTSHVSGTQPRHYGRGELANLCANWLMGVFGSPEIPAPSETNPTFRPKPLKDFIAHILRRVHAEPPVTFCALYFLNRLKEIQPSLGSTTGHALFFAAFLIAGKVLPDTAYSNKDMARITEGMFPLRVANQLEREFLGKLDWDIRPPDVQTAREFEEQVRKHYSDGRRPWMGPFRRHTTSASTTPVTRIAPRNDSNSYPYPIQPPAHRATESRTHSSSQPQHTFQPATARPQLRVDAGIAGPAMSSTSHSSRSTQRDHCHNAARHPPPLMHPAYESDSSSAAPSPITPEDYQDPRARTTGSLPKLSKMILGPGYVLHGGDPSKLGSPAGEPRVVLARDYYATMRPSG
ncbi:hypothetical protein GSI_04078 [Ganoderma sinense ZZ0214-1]|uniref:Cyclin N-terminal domain-containing protein n=1 Tax=Ganoderma sinense ZZ0214-1 TaxID=1077348 RepID=A0A2G8SI55_9APHY|nr:hypothetical protein GSI_04078 [Ganoderma sinense ZZ0214-1]